MNDIRHDFAPPPPVLRRWWFIGATLVIIVALTTIIVALMTGARPGGWLDVALNASGCLGVLAEHDRRPRCCTRCKWSQARSAASVFRRMDARW